MAIIKAKPTSPEDGLGFKLEKSFTKVGLKRLLLNLKKEYQAEITMAILPCAIKVVAIKGFIE